MSEMITVPIKIEKDELWSEVFGAFEGYFGWWKAIKYIDTDWKTHGVVELVAYSDVDNSTETVTKEVTVTDLAEAYALCVERGYHHCGQAINIHDMDECASDMILQTVMFGDVIYG